MTIEDHLKLIIGELTVTIAQQRAEIDRLKELVPKESEKPTQP